MHNDSKIAKNRSTFILFQNLRLKKNNNQILISHIFKYSSNNSR